MVKKWSQELALQFDLRLPADVSAWFDAELWKQEFSTHFGWPVEPKEIPTCLWGGQMLPDTLPVLGNMGGDYLCLRIGADGTVSEVIRWLHEGGFWTSYGNSFAEALLFEAALEQKSRSAEEEDETGPLPFVDWLLDGAGGAVQVGKFEEALGESGGPCLEGLLRAGVAEVAVRWQLCERSWMSGLQKYCRQKEGGDALAEKMGVKWSEFSRWLFDTALFPEKLKPRLARATGESAEDLLCQDWVGANRHAERVIELRTDLSWPFAVGGWAAERQGNRALALERYRAGIRALGSAAEFTDDWGRPAGQGHTKFVIDRLCDLRDELPAGLREDSYLRAALATDHGVKRFFAIRDYWIEKGQESERAGHPDRAYWCYYRAGWDLYCTDDMEKILDRLEGAAKAAGWQALARLAAQHRRCVAR